MEMATADSNKILSAWAAVDGRKVAPSGKNVKLLPAAALRSDDAVKLHELNIKPMTSTRTKYIVDVIPDYEGHIDPIQVHAMMKEHKYKDLPVPFKEKSDTEDFAYSMDVLIDKQDNGKSLIIKVISLTSPHYTHKLKAHFIYGIVHQSHWAPADPYRTRKVLLYLFERMHGFKILSTLWQDELSSSKTMPSKTREQVKSQYDYLRTKADKLGELNL